MAESTHEIYHRMKNHLSMVGSLITLQKAHLSNQEAIDNMEKLRIRIQSIAMVHENLYRGGNPNCLNMADFIRDLVHRMSYSLNSGEDKTNIDLNIEDIAIDTDTSVPLSLIITELVTNALRHGGNGIDGAVSLVFKREETTQVLFSISNAGSPFPAEINLDNPATFGFQLVQGLIEQLKGTILLTDRNNSAFEVRIPASPLA